MSSREGHVGAIVRCCTVDWAKMPEEMMTTVVVFGGTGFLEEPIQLPGEHGNCRSAKSAAA